MQSTVRVLSCLLFLSSTASAQFMSLETIKARAAEAPAFKAAAQNVFEYKLESFPKEAGACLPVARQVGANLERVARVKVLQTVCNEDGADGYKITVTYEAPAALEPVSTTTRSIHEGGFGAYESLAACQAALAGEVSAFKEATGLDPVVSYCFQDRLARDDAWTIRIDSFGKAQAKPDVRSVLIFTYPRGYTKEQFTGQVKTKLQEQGVNVRSVSWRGDAGYASLNVAYYGKNRLVLKQEEPIKVQTQGQCEAALAELDRNLAGRSPEPLIHFCGTTFIGGWEVAWLFKDKPSLKTVKAAEAFATYEACAAGKERVMQYYRDSMGHNVLGAICSNEVLDSSWKVILLE